MYIVPITQNKHSDFHPYKDIEIKFGLKLHVIFITFVVILLDKQKLDQKQQCRIHPI